MKRISILVLTLLLLVAVLAAAQVGAPTGKNGEGPAIEESITLDPAEEDTVPATPSTDSGSYTLTEDSIPNLEDLPPPEFKQPPPEAVEALKAMNLARDAGTPNCDSPLGTKLGTANGVDAFSNCNEYTTTNEDHVFQYQHHKSGEIMSYNVGMKWQCVEYARRYLLKKHGVVFAEVMGAVDIWRYTSAFEPGDDRDRTHLGRYPNFDEFAEQFPRVGAMVIWPMQKDMPYGHVAIISDVIDLPARPQDKFKPANAQGEKLTTVATLRIAEQNFHSKPWENEDYARELLLVKNEVGHLGIVDPQGYSTLGWMQLEPEIKPLDTLMHLDFENDLQGGMPKVVEDPDMFIEERGRRTSE